MSAVTLDYLDWDSEQLGIPCGLINLSKRKQLSASHELAAQVKILIEQSGHLEFITVKLAAPCITAVNTLITMGSRLIDNELVFISSKADTPADGDYRFVFCAETDPDPFLPLADEMQFSRFFVDTRIPKHKACRLWQASIRNHCNGLADKLLVAYCDDRPCGLIVMKFENKRDLILPIVGVLNGYREKGIGRRMLGKIIGRYGNSHQIFVETQSTNQPAQKLYLSAGFRCHGMTHILHYWRS